MGWGKRREEPEPEQSHDQWLADQMSDAIGDIDWANMTDEERQAAQALLELMGNQYTEDWQIGLSIGTVPNTPWETEGDTGEQPIVKKR